MASVRNAGRRAGYTLVELMVVVTIIASSVLMFAPGVGRSLADRRVSDLSRELIRIGRRARSESLGYLRAHLLLIQPSAGRVQLLRGPTGSCRFARWKNIQADCDASPVGPRCLEDLKIAKHTGGDPVALFEQTAAQSYSNAQRALCYSSSGAVLTSDETLQNLAGDLQDQNSNEGGFVYTLHAGTASPVPTDRVHRVLFPLGTTPRAVR